jgi:hypothetical protein
MKDEREFGLELESRRLERLFDGDKLSERDPRNSCKNRLGFTHRDPKRVGFRWGFEGHEAWPGISETKVGLQSIPFFAEEVFRARRADGENKRSGCSVHDSSLKGWRASGWRGNFNSSLSPNLGTR